jgi:septin family protein
MFYQTPSDFDAKPMVMLLGQYSTGKTTFIKHLLKREYPGERISTKTCGGALSELRLSSRSDNLALCPRSV